MRVLGNVQHGRGLTGGRVQLEQAVELQQTQRAGFVGGVVRDGDGRAVRNGIKGDCLRRVHVQAHRLVVHRARADQMRAVLRVEILEVGDVLEVVRVQIARFELKVRLNVIVEDDDFKVDAFFGKNRLGRFENLGMRGGGCADDELGVGAGDADRGGQREGKSERKKLFHGIVLLKIKGFDLLLILGMYSKPFGFESESGERRSQFRTRLSVLREIFMPTIWMTCISTISRATVTKSTSV